MKSNLFIMCGAPGSGKSYYIKHEAPDYAVVVSRDAIRFSMISDEDEYFSKEKAVFKEYVRQIQENLDNGKTVFADATHLNGISRYKLINNLNLENTRVYPIYFKIPLDVCLQRNSKRTGRAKVPDSALINMYHSMTDPINDAENFGYECYEGILYVEEK